MQHCLIGQDTHVHASMYLVNSTERKKPFDNISEVHVNMTSGCLFELKITCTAFTNLNDLPAKRQKTELSTFFFVYQVRNKRGERRNFVLRVEL